MKLPTPVLVILLLSSVVAGCAGKSTKAPFNVFVRGPASACTIKVNGRKVSTNELLSIARPEAKPGRRAHIDANMAETPYRCLGGAIYTLQMAGFKDVGFISEPPPQAK